MMKMEQDLQDKRHEAAKNAELAQSKVAELDVRRRIEEELQ